MLKKIFLWVAAVIITLAAVVYQRITGPTKPLRVEFTYAGEVYKTKFARSLETPISVEQSKDYNSLGYTVDLEIPIDSSVSKGNIYLKYKRYPTNDTLTTINGEIYCDGVKFSLPAQPPAGKLIYSVYMLEDGLEKSLGEDIIIRFKNSVPMWVLLPHVLLMFIAMLLANYTGFISLFRGFNHNRMALLTIIVLGAGGLIFGPLVQKFAFGEFWTGWPLGEDFTDNKTLVAFIVWVVAYMMNRSKSRRYIYVIAAVIMMLVYSVPHSTAGSEFDHSKGEVITGR